MLILCLLLLSACVSNTAAYDAEMQNWVGLSQETLYESWGNPNSVMYVSPNEKVVTYLQVDNGPIDGNTEPYEGSEVEYSAIATPNYGFPSNQPQTYYCKTSFTIVGNQVVNYTFNGDDCVAGD